MTWSPFTVELLCPQCRTRIATSIESSACIVSHTCPGCGLVIRPRPGEGCIFSSYGNANPHRNMANVSRCLPDRGERFHAVVGTSPFNSYYSEGRLTALLAWANEHFDHIDVFIPDTPTVWTLEAGGYPPKRPPIRPGDKCATSPTRLVALATRLALQPTGFVCFPGLRWRGSIVMPRLNNAAATPSPPTGRFNRSALQQRTTFFRIGGERLMIQAMGSAWARSII